MTNYQRAAAEFGNPIVNPFLGQLPPAITVTQDDGTYNIPSNYRHVKVKRPQAENKTLAVVLPDPALPECRGLVYSITIEQTPENYAGTLTISDGKREQDMSLVSGTYSFVCANGTTWAFLNDWTTWGMLLELITATISDHEQILSTIESTIANHEQILSTIESTIANHEQRITALEGS